MVSNYCTIIIIIMFLFVDCSSDPRLIHFKKWFIGQLLLGSLYVCMIRNNYPFRGYENDACVCKRIKVYCPAYSTVKYHATTRWRIKMWLLTRIKQVKASLQTRWEISNWMLRHVSIYQGHRSDWRKLELHISIGLGRKSGEREIR